MSFICNSDYAFTERQWTYVLGGGGDSYLGIRSMRWVVGIVFNSQPVLSLLCIYMCVLCFSKGKKTRHILYTLQSSWELGIVVCFILAWRQGVFAEFQNSWCLTVSRQPKSMRMRNSYILSHPRKKVCTHRWTCFHVPVHVCIQFLSSLVNTGNVCLYTERGHGSPPSPQGCCGEGIAVLTSDWVKLWPDILHSSKKWQCPGTTSCYMSASLL